VTIRVRVASSTEAAPSASLAPQHRDIWGRNDYHSKVEFSLSRTHGHHAKNIRGQVPRGTPLGEN
jgi:hypothetical protein